jgi:hypothetical protein
LDASLWFSLGVLAGVKVSGFNKINLILPLADPLSLSPPPMPFHFGFVGIYLPSVHFPHGRLFRPHIGSS